ncbi:hypothetical protein A3C09_00450 [Candidatus Uhrbacteria bacterium RIFCSPHIGHO2_02_FULL_47_44]|uniref:ABC transporter substrate-binding protein n=1 Tax=Candidatus Uhrbacteria bacterium RIFCSPLOWO2_02_FULL_48_18 TaxID=1802408 RepID=A0A1F7VAQ7_9BACT|nr:MAG: hypothetical protein A2839_03460 [Candidatus Uhrbacteria bacterium RIFCSPHIGHO2_01_FULL_47_10]OGL70853.1 MAG: hypothetical protein A3C09_00450 [Candidatus Uhrbacteria bacterium RIFCSPHIGHO2_02_FULL_47_44]OGL75830.1 MAG: hypothetical protein A3E97_03850 [Candidatus Uhrbacteria bacterium RIFCSPHIGHO2_12_FULL_47_12]OGL81953.1 MAG: hypothetical protein A3B20_02625 [Candidatus Uhrbacteria bacterium RIFCSPLOWO2_01_FULL_47_17]OGL87117.1 MAG: hypothetical protein A3I41_04220 [Candidatus Uhrbact
MHFLKKNWPVLILVLFVVSIVTWVLTAPSQKQSTNSADQKLRVVASFYPIAEFARHVGGDLVNVETITPVGVEPHEYEPTAQQLERISESDLFLYNGEGLDAWADPIGAKLGIGERSWIMSHTVTLIEHDPHIWLNPVLAKQEVMWIYSALSYVDPTHDAIYKQNAEAYINQLSALDEAYAHGLKTCANRTVVTSHEAFAYLAKQYKFETIAITGLSPEEEPSAGRLAEIAKLAKEKQIKYIFFETLVSPKLAQTLASEIGAQTLVFDPIEGVSEEDQAAGKNYVSIMQENLTNLKIGMMCQ